jgi:hypothetical protein
LNYTRKVCQRYRELGSDIQTWCLSFPSSIMILDYSTEKGHLACFADGNLKEGYFHWCALRDDAGLVQSIQSRLFIVLKGYIAQRKLRDTVGSTVFLIVPYVLALDYMARGLCRGQRHCLDELYPQKVVVWFSPQQFYSTFLFLIYFVCNLFISIYLCNLILLSMSDVVGFLRRTKLAHHWHFRLDLMMLAAYD